MTTFPARQRRQARRLHVVVFLVALAGLFATFALAAPVASAHAILESSTPADGSVLKTSPSKVTLNFSENVTLPPNAVVVLDSAKHRVDTGNAHTGSKGSQVVVGLKANLPKGSYLVAWHVISADTHPVHGGVVFSVGAPGPTASLSAANNVGVAREWKIAEFVTRAFAFVALFFVAGAAVYLHWIAGDDGRRRGVARLLDAAVVVGVVALAVQVPFLAAQATGQGLGALTEHGVLGDTLRNGVGWSVVAGVVGLVVLRLSVALRARSWARAVALVGFAGVLASFVLVGHTRSTTPGWLVVLSELCHVSAGSVWFGGLVLLVLDLRARRRTAVPKPAGADVLAREAAAPATGAREAAVLVRRFSGFATVAVLAVIVAGGVLGYLEVRSVHALVSTAYGRLLIAKVAVVAVVALMGAYNHFRLVPAVDRFGDDTGSGHWRHLGNTVRAEAVLLVAVLCLTAVLGNLVPGRTATANSGKLFAGSARFGDGSINIVVDPARVGVNQIHIYVLDAEGRQVDATSSIQVQLTLPAEGLGPITKVPVKAGPGHYQVLGMQIPLPGTWTLTITSAVSEFTNNNVSFQVPVHS